VSERLRRAFFLLTRPAQDDADYDAAEIDRELIASRLQHDVVRCLRFRESGRHADGSRPRLKVGSTRTSRLTSPSPPRTSSPCLRSCPHRWLSRRPLCGFPPSEEPFPATACLRCAELVNHLAKLGLDLPRPSLRGIGVRSCVSQRVKMASGS
jgi:hypothetical protein